MSCRKHSRSITGGSGHAAAAKTKPSESASKHTHTHWMRCGLCKLHLLVRQCIRNGVDRGPEADDPVCANTLSDIK